MGRAVIIFEQIQIPYIVYNDTQSVKVKTPSCLLTWYRCRSVVIDLTQPPDWLTLWLPHIAQAAKRDCLKYAEIAWQ